MKVKTALKFIVMLLCLYLSAMQFSAILYAQEPPMGRQPPVGQNPPVPQGQLHNASMESILRAIEKMRDTGGPGVGPILQQFAFRHPNKEVREAAGDAIRYMINSRGIKNLVLVPVFEPLPPTWNDKEAIAEAQRLLNDTPKIDDKVASLIGDLLNGDIGKKSLAIGALGRMGPAAKDAIPALIAALKDPERQVRVMTAIALQRIGPTAKDAIPYLIPLLNDVDPLTRLEAAKALDKITNENRDNSDIIPVLKKAFEEETDMFVKTGEGITLGRFGVFSKDNAFMVIESLDRDYWGQDIPQIFDKMISSGGLPYLIEALTATNHSKALIADTKESILDYYESMPNGLLIAGLTEPVIFQALVNRKIREHEEELRLASYVSSVQLPESPSDRDDMLYYYLPRPYSDKLSYNAMTAFSKLDPAVKEAAVPLLTEAAKRYGIIPKEILDALVKVGGPTIPALKEYLKDGGLSDGNRKAIEETIEKIKPKQKEGQKESSDTPDSGYYGAGDPWIEVAQLDGDKPFKENRTADEPIGANILDANLIGANAGGGNFYNIDKSALAAVNDAGSYVTLYNVPDSWGQRTASFSGPNGWPYIVSPENAGKTELLVTVTTTNGRVNVEIVR